MRLTDPRDGKQAPIDMDLQERWAREIGEWSRHACTHVRQKLCRGKNKGGAPVVRMQCLDCSEGIGNPVKRPPDAEELPEFDDAKHEEYNAARKSEQDNINQKYIDIQLRRWKGKEQGDSYYTQAHNAYLESPAWRERRRLVKERAQGLCEGCRAAASTEVHHLTYAHWGQEFLFELVALCGDCHDRVHAKGNHEALIEGCKTCLHASKGNFCLLYDMPMPMALDAEGPCTFERYGFEPVQ